MYLSALILLTTVVSAIKPNIIHIMGDDVGYDNIGLFNSNKSTTPNLNALLGRDGIFLSSYHTFKICGPSRASAMTGRYPFNLGFYGDGKAQHITNYTTTAELLSQHGYTTSAIGKWDVGYVVKETTATFKGFDTFLGYYMACNDDLFYHTKAVCSKETTSPTDMSRNVGTHISPEKNVNGTYSTRLFTTEAISVLKNHFGSSESPTRSNPIYMYIAPQNVHLACGTISSKIAQGIQAPCTTVNEFEYVKNDTYKGQSAVTRELDYLVGNITTTLKQLKQWNNTILIFTSDNGGPLDHTTNYPLRGGKHTFWDGGVRVLAGISGGYIPVHTRGTVWHGLSHSADWYRTIVEGMTNGTIPNVTGPMPDDSFNLWTSIISPSSPNGSKDNSKSPRNDIIHQVSNQYFTEHVIAIRSGDYKLIIGNPGDARLLKWPELSSSPLQFGLTGGKTRDSGTTCLSGIVTGTQKNMKHGCKKGCLYNIINDQGETNNLIHNTSLRSIVNEMKLKLSDAGKNAPKQNSYWSDPSDELEQICISEIKTGYLEPINT